MTRRIGNSVGLAVILALGFAALVPPSWASPQASGTSSKATPPKKTPAPAATVTKTPPKSKKDPKSPHTTTPAPAGVNLTNVYSESVPGGAIDIANALGKLKIGGVIRVDPVGDQAVVFILDAKAAKANQTATGPDGKPNTADPIAELEQLLHQKVLGLTGGTLHTEVVAVTGKAADVVTASKQVPGVLSATALGDTSMMVIYDSKSLAATQFVAKLLDPRPLQPRVDSLMQRLYYIDDPLIGAAAAKAINDTYPDVAATFLAPDMVQLSMPKPPKGVALGSTDSLDDARRAIAQMDQPRPRASLDAWAIQIASEDPKMLELVTPRIEQVTSAYNEVMNRSVLAGWSYLTAHSAPDLPFTDYISKVSVANRDLTNGQQCCYTGDSRVVPSPKATPTYALGFQSMFAPVTPSLINMLINLAAQKDPYNTAKTVIDTMEGKLAPDDAGKLLNQATGIRTAALRVDKTSLLLKSDFTEANDEDTTSDLGKMRCRQRDAEVYRAWIETQHQAGPTAPKVDGLTVPPNLVLSCVRTELLQHLFYNKADSPTTSALGQMRAAMANFLFQYKTMVQYPNNFHAYLEPESAQALDVSLLPVVDAFYEDLGAFQEAMQGEIYKLLQSKGVSYSSSGLVTVKMIAGLPSTVTSSSQNSFDVPQTIPVGDLTAAIAKLQLDPAGGAADLFNALVPKPVTASIGKSLNLTSTVHSLSGAHGMELDLDIASTEGAPSLFAQNSTTAQSTDMNSRVTAHHLTTKVRVDSLKLFEVSTMRSLVVRGQKPWVPFDPLEIPGLGYIFKYKLKPKAVFTQSLLFINAIVVPTAADLGYGAPLTEDTQADASSGRLLFHPLNTVSDIATDQSQYRVESFHNAMVRCFSTQYVFGTAVAGKCNPREPRPVDSPSLWPTLSAQPAIVGEPKP